MQYLFQKEGIVFISSNRSPDLLKPKQWLPFVITKNPALIFVLYLSTCCKTLSDNGTFISLHSIIMNGLVSLSYTTISKRFFMSPSSNCFSTAINVAG